MSASLGAPFSPQSVDPPPKGIALSKEQRELYGPAIRALERSALGRDPKLFGAARDLALHHCTKARAFDWRERQSRKRKRETSLNWDAVNKSAVKLALHFKKLDDQTGEARLAVAIIKSGLKMKSSPERSLPAAFAQLLRALAKQPRFLDHDDRIGPLWLPWSRKLISREDVLTLVIAHSFYLVANHDDSSKLTLAVNDKITRGTAWSAAALFASAALGQDASDPGSARKYLSTHADKLYYLGWS